MVDEEYNALLRLAVAIFRRLPLAGGSEFSMRDAMVMAGVKKELAGTEKFKT
jgi:seryl-tRNA(Sec) selenium transferase